MLINQYEIWIADLNSQIGLEAGKTRPVLIVQTNLLNNIAHSSTIFCVVTAKVQHDSKILRVHLIKGTANVLENFDIMFD